MVYIPITYVPDGPVTAALKKRTKRRRPKPSLGNLGPLLDENLVAAKKHGHFLYHPDDLRRLKDVHRNPDVVDEGFAVLREVMTAKGIGEPEVWNRTNPHYPDVKRIVIRAALLAAAMTIGITVAVLLGQDDAIAAMVVAIVAISLVGAAVLGLILTRTVIEVEPAPGLDGQSR